MSPSTLLVFDGQSLGLTPFVMSQSWPYKLGQALGRRIAVANNAGTTYAQREANIANRLDSLFDRAVHNVLFDDGGTYNIEDGQGDMDAAGTLAVMTAYTAARRAAGAEKIIRLTIPPATILTGDEEVQRVAINNALRANPQQYGYDHVVDLDSVPELTNSGDVTYYSDGIHWTDAATTLVANKVRTSIPDLV